MMYYLLCSIIFFLIALVAYTLHHYAEQQAQHRKELEEVPRLRAAVRELEDIKREINHKKMPMAISGGNPMLSRQEYVMALQLEGYYQVNGIRYRCTDTSEGFKLRSLNHDAHPETLLIKALKSDV